MGIGGVDWGRMELAEEGILLDRGGRRMGGASLGQRKMCDSFGKGLRGSSIADSPLSDCLSLRGNS
jgi:hypothetical protein